MRVKVEGWGVAGGGGCSDARELGYGLGADGGEVAVGEQVDRQAAVGQLLLEAARPLVTQEDVDAEEACRG